MSEPKPQSSVPVPSPCVLFLRTWIPLGIQFYWGVPIGQAKSGRPSGDPRGTRSRCQESSKSHVFLTISGLKSSKTHVFFNIYLSKVIQSPFDFTCLECSKTSQDLTISGLKSLDPEGFLNNRQKPIGFCTFQI